MYLLHWKQRQVHITANPGPLLVDAFSIRSSAALSSSRRQGSRRRLNEDLPDSEQLSSMFRLGHLSSWLPVCLQLPVINQLLRGSVIRTALIGRSHTYTVDPTLTYTMI